MRRERDEDEDRANESDNGKDQVGHRTSRGGRKDDRCADILAISI